MKYPQVKIPATAHELAQNAHERMALTFPRIIRSGNADHLFDREFKPGDVIQACNDDGERVPMGFVKICDDQWLKSSYYLMADHAADHTHTTAAVSKLLSVTGYQWMLIG